jgi:hypothetical protein
MPIMKITYFLILILSGCSSFYFTDGKTEYHRVSFAVLSHANKASMTIEDKSSGTKSTLRLEGVESDQISGAAAISEGVTKGVINGMKP